MSIKKKKFWKRRKSTSSFYKYSLIFIAEEKIIKTLGSAFGLCPLFYRQWRIILVKWQNKIYSVYHVICLWFLEEKIEGTTRKEAMARVQENNTVHVKHGREFGMKKGSENERHWIVNDN